MKLFFRTAKIKSFAVLFFLLNIDFSCADQIDCMSDFRRMQDRFYYSNFEMNLSNSTGQDFSSFNLIHRYKNKSSVSIWKSLNGEVFGYVLKNLKGYDFNNDRNVVHPLSWHETLIFDRLFDKNSKLDGYSCVVAGRTRLQGRKVTVLRLAPQDDLRYSYFIGKDDASSLPIDLGVMSPDGYTALRLSVTALKLGKVTDKQPEDSIFEKFKTPENDTVISSHNALTAWEVLNLPKSYKIVDEGSQAMTDGTMSDFQVFSDGVTDFRVYRSPKTTISVPAVRNGTLSILRRNGIDYEYAVTGEIPLEIAEVVLSKLQPVKN